MARIPYARLDDDAVRPLAERITAERGSVLHLYQMLLHSPPVAQGWLGYLTAIRHQCSLDGALRELVIMRVALINGAPYEAEQHAPIARKEGVSQAKLDALGHWQDCQLFGAKERAVLDYTEVMTRHVHVPDAVFAEMATHFEPSQIIELTATIAAYNMVSRFLEALQIHSDDARE
ncbi:carboxymuconolactone decarboxylase family protein [Pseudacidovorax sp. NFM-22]|uniref:carboxymuconolactone decarboxylase family protein n=1 Tax=Pseudacidovorax sp. NFM-22 TaxID=2744469 RepID=UPI001F30CEF8|nr:carboxymuconolactone decarboxylase family protein [Pseudacidovorax sp. NFM-22]